MKRSWVVIKFILLFALIIFLFSFTNERNEKRKLSRIEVEFIDENSPYILLNTVNKLLILNYGEVMTIAKETLVLNEMESRLRENPMIRDAQVFMTVDGVLQAKIEQRTPIGRVISSPDYYLDTDGKKMPLSSVSAARVPLINVGSTIELVKVRDLLLKINEDPFMKSSVVGLEIKEDEKIVLQLRKQNFKLHLGQVEEIDRKFQNYKAFYQKSKQDNTLSDYNLVNLEFISQVVATK